MVAGLDQSMARRRVIITKRAPRQASPAAMRLNGAALAARLVPAPSLVDPTPGLLSPAGGLGPPAAVVDAVDDFNLHAASMGSQRGDVRLVSVEDSATRYCGTLR